VKKKEPQKKEASYLRIENLTDYPCFDEYMIRLLVEWILVNEKEQGFWTIGFIFVNDDDIVKLNKRYFSIDRPTDVISFNIDDPLKKEGEVYICLDQIGRQANEYGVSVKQETLRVVSHGVYHLLGYRDDTSKEKQHIRELEDRALAYIEGYL
jgi:probable rRNA maturation factor